jgi:hypothetical protein
MKKNLVFLFLVAAIMPISCRKNLENIRPVTGITTITDTAAELLVAEKIIQDIIIKNTNPDDAWTEECLQGMHRDTLVDAVFEMAYSGKAIVYDFDTGSTLSVKQLKKKEKEKGFSRDKIGKIQFIESWYLNPDNVTFTKKVSSFVLGYETYDSQGQFRGYLPVFRMIMNPDQ